MKIKNVITITALSALILAGCGTEKALEEESSKSSSEVEATEIEVVEEVNENEEVNEETAEKLDSPYDEIATYFSEWELPEEGILPKDHEAYYGLAIEIVAYENGYMFETETKEYFGRFSEANAPTPEPTKEQATGLLIGIISEVAGDLANDARQNPHLEGKVVRADDVGDFLPFITLKFEEVVKYANQEDLAKVSTEILNLAKEIDEERRGEVSEEVLKDLNSKYSEMVDKIYQLNKATGREELL